MKNQRETISYTQELEKYKRLLQDIRKKMKDQERGSEVARKINDSFWEKLDAHDKRIDEQLKNADAMEEKPYAKDFSEAESIYEATRSFLSKYDLA